MTGDERQLLEKPLQQMHKAASGLMWALHRCQALTVEYGKNHWQQVLKTE